MAKKETTIKMSRKFKKVLMMMKLDLNFVDLEALIKRMYDLIIKNKLTKEMKNHKGGSK